MRSGASGHEQMQGMAGLGKSNAGKLLSTPRGYGVASELFGQMRRFFASTWFDEVDDDAGYRDRAVVWQSALSRFDGDVVISVMDELVKTGTIRAPDLSTFVGMCEIKKGLIHRTPAVGRAALDQIRKIQQNEVSDVS